MTKRRTPVAIKAMRQNYVGNLMSGMTKNDAATAAGFSPSMARNAASRIETPEVRDQIHSLQQAVLLELPTQLLVQKFREGLDATIVQTARKDGKFTDERAFPDYRIRLRYLEKIASISGRDQPGTVEAGSHNNGGPIDLNSLTTEERRARMRWLEQQLGIVPNETDGTYRPAAPAEAGEGGAR